MAMDIPGTSMGDPRFLGLMGAATAAQGAQMVEDLLQLGIAISSEGELALAADRDSELQKVFDHLGALRRGGRAHEPQEPRISHARSRDVHGHEERARGMPDPRALETAGIPVKLRPSRGTDRSAPVSF